MSTDNNIQPYRCTVCGVEITCTFQWHRAGEILLAAFNARALQHQPSNPQTSSNAYTYTLGCSRTGELYGWNSAVNLALYGGNRAFFVNLNGPTRAT